MKRKSLVTLVLLFVMSFSVVHEYAFAILDTDHCSVTEYADEIAGPVHKGDICDIHFEYHLAYILPPVNQLVVATNISTKPIIQKESYKFSPNLDFIKPPVV
jgi:hypothetical protein